MSIYFLKLTILKNEITIMSWLLFLISRVVSVKDTTVNRQMKCRYFRRVG